MSINPNIKFEDELQDQDNIVERTNGHRASNRIEYKNANISLSITSCFSVQFVLGEEARDEFKWIFIIIGFLTFLILLISLAMAKLF